MESGMDPCERWAKEYLKFVGIPEEEIVFEPKGPSTFPDFAIRDKIGLEVRRLNQHVEAKTGEWESLEKLSHPLQQRLSNLLQSFGSPLNGHSWWAYYRFERPQITKRWESALRAKLLEFLKAPSSERDIIIDQHFDVSLIRRRSPASFTFTLAGNSDRNSGGWVETELQKNLAICIDEKTRKREPYRSLYPEWWLILIDHFNGGQPADVQIDHNWDKVIVIYPDHYSYAYEVVAHART